MRRKSRHDLPRRVYFNRGFYWYSEPRPGKTDKWHKLGKEWNLAARIEWAKLSGEDFSSARRNTFADMLDAYLEHIEKDKTHSPTTIADSKVHAVELKRIFGNMLPDEVKPQHIARYLETRMVKHKPKKGQPAPPPKRAPIRANREKATLSSAFAWGMRNGFAAVNPAFGVRNNKEKRKDRAPELWEIRAVQKHCNAQWSAVIDLALLVGQRGVDIRKITHDDILPEGVLFVQTKRGAKVLVEWDDALRAVIRALASIKKGKVASDYLIPARKGAMYSASGWKTMLNKAVTRALLAGDLKERFSFHDLRAANATIEHEQGGSAQRRLGHTTEKQTADYVRSKRATKVKPLKLEGQS